MRKTISMLIVCLFLTVSATSNAGTLMLGVKGWYTWWDSAIGDFTTKAADASIEEFFGDFGLSADLRSDTDQGDGILAGPLLSYQTDDGLWSMSLAWMGYGSFSQDADLMATVDGNDYSAAYDLDLDRSEIDFAISRNVSERFKVFLGYKHQKMEYKYKLSEAAGEQDIYKAEATMTIPTVGIGYVHPLSDTMVIGIQGGLLLVNGNMGYKEMLWPGEGYGGYDYFDTTVGFNGELSLSYMIKQKVILQAGYRYQTMKLKADFNAGEKLDDTDTVHGVVVSAVYMFDL
jgi:hypothetical protein